MTENPELHVYRPQFDRPDSWKEIMPPPDPFERVHTLEKEVLDNLGMRPWDEDSTLWLFPFKWANHIPDNFEVTSILGETIEWKEIANPDKRFGMLAWGIERV